MSARHFVHCTRAAGAVTVTDYPTHAAALAACHAAGFFGGGLPLPGTDPAAPQSWVTATRDVARYREILRSERNR